VVKKLKHLVLQGCNRRFLELALKVQGQGLPQLIAPNFCHLYPLLLLLLLLLLQRSPLLLLFLDLLLISRMTLPFSMNPPFALLLTFQNKYFKNRQSVHSFK
jgi:hypothetical protein